MLQAECMCAADAFYLIIKFYFVEVEAKAKKTFINEMSNHAQPRISSSSSPFEFPQQLVSCDWLSHSHGSLIPGEFDLKINRSMKTP